MLHLLKMITQQLLHENISFCIGYKILAAKDPEVDNLLPSVAGENPLIKQIAQTINNN